MVSLKSYILVNRIAFKEVVNLTIDSSWDKITTTGVVTLNNDFGKKNKDVKNEIERGDNVSFRIGYAPRVTKRFEGYVTDFNTDSPFKVKAEDESWLLKQKTITRYSAKDLTVKSLINNLLDLLDITLTINVIDANIGTWQVQNMTIINVLDELKSKFGMKSFFRNGELFIGYPSFLRAEFPAKYGANEVDFNFDGKDANIISHSLEWLDKKDIRQVIKGTLIQRDNTQTTKYAYLLNGVPTLTAAQPEGNMITRFQYNITQSDMDAYLLAEIDEINYTGFRGSFTTFGDKTSEFSGGIVEHGDKVNLISKKNPEKNGKYVIKHVSLNFGTDGYRQTIELDRQV